MTGTDTSHERDPLNAAALASPEATAVTGPGKALSYRELDSMVSATAGRLRKLGLERGARVALYLSKDERYIVLLLALIRAGIVACPVSTRIPSRSIGPLLEKISCSALISDSEAPPQLTEPHAETLRPGSLVDASPPMDHATIEPSVIPLAQAATIIFSSGSTGAPKAALHTFGNHYYNALGSNANIALGPGDRWLHSLPLYHVGGLSIVFRCLLAGAAIALPDADAGLGEAISGSRATHVSLVATQLRRLLAGDVTLGPLKAVLMGGGPIPDPLVEKAVARGLPIHTSYGLTEMSSQVTTTRPHAELDELRTSGRSLPHREVSISESGEILVRGSTLFAGYVENGKITSPLDEDGWFHTKDLGELDSEGCLNVQGRMDNLFVSGGENVQPEEIEEALCLLAGVEEAVVVPVPDAEFDARPVAFVRTAGGAVDQRSLERELASVLPRFKVPDTFHPWPKDASAGMKPDRQLFQRYALAGLSDAGS